MDDQENSRPQSDALDTEIAALKRRVASMQKRLQIECSTILSSTPIQSMIQASSAAPSSLLATTKDGAAGPDSNNSNSSSGTTASAVSASLRDRSSRQAAYAQQCTYRVSVPVTAFKIRDPDPHAVDGGHVLGIRFEVMSQGHFLRPYYVMFNRPYPGSGARHLRVHRHTVPPAIPLGGLAARHLPAPPRASSSSDSNNNNNSGATTAQAAAAAAGGTGGGGAQNLERFVRALRRDIMRFHNRLGLTADLRRAVGLQRKGRGDGGGGGGRSANEVVEAGIADVEARHIKLAWADGRIGRIVMDKDGKVDKFVVLGPNGGRDWRVMQTLFSARDGVDDIGRKLRRYAMSG